MRTVCSYHFFLCNNKAFNIRTESPNIYSICATCTTLSTKTFSSKLIYCNKQSAYVRTYCINSYKQICIDNFIHLCLLPEGFRGPQLKVRISLTQSVPFCDRLKNFALIQAHIHHVKVVQKINGHRTTLVDRNVFSPSRLKSYCVI